MSAGAAVAAALPSKEPPSYAGAQTTIKVLSLLTAGEHRSMKVKPNNEAGMSPADAPSVPSATSVTTSSLRALVGGYSATLLLSPIVAVADIRCYGVTVKKFFMNRCDSG